MKNVPYRIGATRIVGCITAIALGVTAWLLVPRQPVDAGTGCSEILEYDTTSEAGIDVKIGVAAEVTSSCSLTGATDSKCEINTTHTYSGILPETHSVSTGLIDVPDSLSCTGSCNDDVEAEGGHSVRARVDVDNIQVTGKTLDVLPMPLPNGASLICSSQYTGAKCCDPFGRCPFDCVATATVDTTSVSCGFSMWGDGVVVPFTVCPDDIKVKVSARLDMTVDSNLVAGSFATLKWKIEPVTGSVSCDTGSTDDSMTWNRTTTPSAFASDWCCIAPGDYELWVGIEWSYGVEAVGDVCTLALDDQDASAGHFFSVQASFSDEEGTCD